MNYAKQNCNENSHPALKIFKCGVLQFCLFPFNFLLSKLTNQFESIMQNKPNFRKAKMKLNSYSTKDYENKSNWKLGENKPNAKPIQSQPVVSLPALSFVEVSNLFQKRPRLFVQQLRFSFLQPFRQLLPAYIFPWSSVLPVFHPL